MNNKETEKETFSRLLKELGYDVHDPEYYDLDLKFLNKYKSERLNIEAPTDNEEGLRKIFETMNQDGMFFSDFKSAIELLTKGEK